MSGAVEILRQGQDEYSADDFPIVTAEVFEVAGEQVGRLGIDRGEEDRSVFGRQIDPPGQGEVAELNDLNTAEQAGESSPLLRGLEIAARLLDGIPGSYQRGAFKFPQLEQPRLG